MDYLLYQLYYIIYLLLYLYYCIYSGKRVSQLTMPILLVKRLEPAWWLNDALMMLTGFTPCRTVRLLLPLYVLLGKLHEGVGGWVMMIMVVVVRVSRRT